MVGIFRPVILIPGWLINESNPEKLVWSLRHELMHWKMGDPIANSFRQLLNIIFYFHPATWFTGNQWEKAMEKACDRALVKDSKEIANYSELLYQMLIHIHRRKRPSLASGLFATRNQVSDRIASLLTDTFLRTSPYLGRFSQITTLILGIVVLSVGIGFVSPTLAQIPNKSEKIITKSQNLPQTWSDFIENSHIGGSSRDDYEYKIENISSKRSIMYIESKPSYTEGFGALTRKLSGSELDRFHGNLIHVCASIKAENVSDWSGLYVMVVDKNGRWYG